MKFLVKHPRTIGQVFLSNEYIGLSNDPVFHARADALEAYYEHFIENNKPVVKPFISVHGDVSRIEPQLQ